MLVCPSPIIIPQDYLTRGEGVNFTLKLHGVIYKIMDDPSTELQSCFDTSKVSVARY